MANEPQQPIGFFQFLLGWACVLGGMAVLVLAVKVLLTFDAQTPALSVFIGVLALICGVAIAKLGRRFLHGGMS